MEEKTEKVMGKTIGMVTATSNGFSRPTKIQHRAILVNIRADTRSRVLEGWFR